MIVHGTVDHSGFYAELGEHLAAQGVAVFASDMRGWGLSDGEPLYFHDIEVFSRDVVADYERIHGNGSGYAGVSSRFLLGKSIGGLITAWTASRNPGMWTGLIGLSGAYQLKTGFMLGGILLRACLRAAALFVPKLPLRRPFDPQLITSDAAELEAWRQDPLVSHGKLTVGYMAELLRALAHLPALLTGLRVPALMLWGSDDQVVSVEGHRMLVTASGHEASRLIVYPGGRHNLLGEPTLKAGLMSDMQGWMESIAQRKKPQ